MVADSSHERASPSQSGPHTALFLGVRCDLFRNLHEKRALMLPQLRKSAEGPHPQSTGGPMRKAYGIGICSVEEIGSFKTATPDPSVAIHRDGRDACRQRRCSMPQTRTSYLNR